MSLDDVFVLLVYFTGFVGALLVAWMLTSGVIWLFERWSEDDND